MPGFQDSRPAQYLKWLNGGAMLLHVTYFVLGVLLYINGSLSIKLVQDVPTYYSNVSGAVNASQCDIVEKDFLVSYTSDCSVGEWDGLLALSICEIITALFHLFYILELVTPNSNPVFTWWKSQAHLLRWVEYGLTATTISIAATMGSGTRNLSTFVALWISLPAVQLCGYAIERVVVERKRAGFSTAIEWVVFAIGCLGQLAVFGTVAVNLYFGDSGNVLVGQSLTSESYDGWKVQGILFFISFSFFPIIAVLWMVAVIKHFWFVEICYIYGSFSAKTSLFWLITSTLQEYLETFKAVDETGVNWTAVRYSMGVAIPLAIDLIFPLLTRYVFLKSEYEDFEQLEFASADASVTVQTQKPMLRKRTGTASAGLAF